MTKNACDTNQHSAPSVGWMSEVIYDMMQFCEKNDVGEMMPSLMQVYVTAQSLDFLSQYEAELFSHPKRAVASTEQAKKAW
jgi:hypothetical protein